MVLPSREVTYADSFAHKSWKWKTAAFERQLLLEGPIFHFNDYGKKGIHQLDSCLKHAEKRRKKCFTSPSEPLKLHKNKTKAIGFEPTPRTPQKCFTLPLDSISLGGALP